MRIVDNTLLTEREKEIILLILEGKTKQEIADSFCLSVSTIKSNVENIYRKFDVHNKAELIVYIIKNKIIELN